MDTRSFLDILKAGSLAFTWGQRADDYRRPGVDLPGNRQGI